MTSHSDEKQEQKRTKRQNRALHKYFTMVAETLNDAGLDMKKVLKPEVDIPWSKDTIKDFLWRPVQKAQLGKKSTTEMTTTDITAINETIIRHLGEKFGALLPSFPSVTNYIDYEK